MQGLNYLKGDRPDGNRYLICMQGPYITFFLYEKGWHQLHKFNLKYHKMARDLLGLSFDWNTQRVRVINQHNTLEPQIRIYDLRKTNDKFAVLMLSKWVLFHVKVPKVIIVDSISVPGSKELVFRHSDLGIRKQIGESRTEFWRKVYMTGSGDIIEEENRKLKGKAT